MKTQFKVPVKGKEAYLRLSPEIEVLVGDMFTFSVLIAQLLEPQFLPCPFNLLVRAGECPTLHHAEVLPRMTGKHFNP